MTKRRKSILFWFSFHLIYWMIFSYVTLKQKETWNWGTNILGSAIYSLLMTYMFTELGKNHQLYLVPSQGENLTRYLIEQGFEVKKKNRDTIYFKKAGISWNPFIKTTIYESSFYTLITSTKQIIEKVPEHLKRIRQPI